MYQNLPNINIPQPQIWVQPGKEEPGKNPLPKFPLKKIILAVVVFVIVAELVWAGLNLRSQNTAVESGKIADKDNSVAVNQGASIILQASRTKVKVGEKIAVTINEESTRPTDGTDIILYYDPNLLTVVADEISQEPVAVGSLYTDYPVNVVDEEKGRVAISGVTSKIGGEVVNGVFGLISFKAKAPGLAKITLDFTQGSTIDTNVIETKTAKDLLEKVVNLELTIQQ